jgi:hypothetical protein
VVLINFTLFDLDAAIWEVRGTPSIIFVVIALEPRVEGYIRL